MSKSMDSKYLMLMPFKRHSEVPEISGSRKSHAFCFLFIRQLSAWQRHHQLQFQCACEIPMRWQSNRKTSLTSNKKGGRFLSKALNASKAKEEWQSTKVHSETVLIPLGLRSSSEVAQQLDRFFGQPPRKTLKSWASAGLGTRYSGTRNWQMRRETSQTNETKRSSRSRSEVWAIVSTTFPSGGFGDHQVGETVRSSDLARGAHGAQQAGTKRFHEYTKPKLIWANLS